MAGFSYEDLIQRAKAGRKPAGSPSPAAPPQDKADAGPSAVTPAAASKRERPQSRGKEILGDLPHKKTRLTKEKDPSKKSHASLDLEHPSDSDFERFKADPLLFASEIARAGSRLLAKMKQGEEERTAGMLLSAKNLWLEGDNLDKSDKLNRAYDYISELRQQLEAQKLKTKEAEDALKPTTEALNKARSSLQSVEKERDTAVTRLSKAEDDLRLEQEKNSKLGEELASEKRRAETAEESWHKLDNDFDGLIQSTVTLCNQRFEEAVRQVRYVYPTYEINEQIIKPDHTMKGGRIVIPERRNADGEVVESEVVIYERPA